MLTVYWLLHPDHSRCLVNKYMKEWDQGSGWGGAGGGREHILLATLVMGFLVVPLNLQERKRLKTALGPLLSKAEEEGS